MQRDDEVVAGAGAGDVEQPHPLAGVHLLVDRLGGVEIAGLDVLTELERAAARRRPHHVDAAPESAGLAAHPGQDHDGEFQSFRRVDGQDPQRVGIGFGQHRLGDAGGFLSLPPGPGEIGPQPAVLGL